MDKIMRIVLPKLSQIIEHQQFRLLKQEENEPINSFEARVRNKAAHCEFDTCNCGKRSSTCQFDQDEEEIRDQILCNMREKTLQMELWRKEKTGQGLEHILSEIRSFEAASDNLSDHASLASGVNKPEKKCFKCDQSGHLTKNCGAEASKKQTGGCGFCSSPKQCKMRSCPAYYTQCNSCKWYSHFARCCTKIMEKFL